MLTLTFQISQERVALDVRRIGEVVPRVPLQRSADSPLWLAGTFVYRQSVVPVIDMHRLTGAGDCPTQLSSRIIVVPWQHSDLPSSWLGLLASHVSEICEIQAPPHAPLSRSRPAEPDLGPAIIDRGEIVRVLDLDRLIPDAVRQRLAGACCS
jgi:chemotaxis signal transduction protein